MKIIRAEFENFRLLRDLKLDFSTSSEKKLTVIRAENDSGKTTIVTALQWAFYGFDVLPRKGKGFRLHPLDWNYSDSNTIRISVKVDFEISDNSIYENENKKQYRIIRSVEETSDGVKQNPEVKLFVRTDSGANPIPDPEAWIKRELLQPELRDVFFIDGDRALSFIEAPINANTKRKHVHEVIRSLLALSVIDSAIKHLEHTESVLNEDAKKIGSDELTEITTKLLEMDKSIAELTKKSEDAELQRDTLDRSLSEIEKEIEAALIKGDQEKLNLQITQNQEQLGEINKKLTDVYKSHSELFKSLSLSRDLLNPVLSKSIGKLNQLHGQGKLPSTTIPVLEERLIGTTCICGESLDRQSVDGKHRRDHIQNLIEQSQKADTLQRTLTDLYYGSLSFQPKEITDKEHWVTKYDQIAFHRYELEKVRDKLQERRAALEVQLEEIGDTNIQGLRVTKQEYIDQRERFNNNYVTYNFELEELKEKRKSLVATRNNLLAKQRKGANILAALDVTKDVTQILHNSYNRIKNEKLSQVSELMNDIFIEMIGVDPEHGAIIQKAQISQDYDIQVYGLNNLMLNPDSDLNGASRRALTVAFILALAKVSEFEAPNVIDTPLGTMSGYVRRSALKIAIRESTQLILFLTRSEIVGCEDILDEEVGQFITLTNPKHYPKMLINDPQVTELNAIRCECVDCRSECHLCKRRMDNVSSV